MKYSYCRSNTVVMKKLFLDWHKRWTLSNGCQKYFHCLVLVVLNWIKTYYWLCNTFDCRWHRSRDQLNVNLAPLPKMSFGKAMQKRQNISRKLWVLYHSSPVCRVSYAISFNPRRQNLVVCVISFSPSMHSYSYKYQGLNFILFSMVRGSTYWLWK